MPSASGGERLIGALLNAAMNTRFLSMAGIAAAVLTSLPVLAQIPAFPGAEGFGALSIGRRGGDVYGLTNLNDSGPGSLRQGIRTATGPRTIVFSVSGNIALQSILYLDKPNITIAGQTAPGDGICLKDYSLDVRNTHDIVVRCLRLRRGDALVWAGS
jgi:hypothetical protein